LYRKEYLYNVDPSDTSLRPFQLLFRALSIRDLDYIRSFNTPNQNELNLIILQKSLLRFFNVITESGQTINEPDISLLTPQQSTTLAHEIYKVSVLTEDIVEKIKLNVILSMNKKFSTDTWSCEMCKHKGIDQQRNCKFREDYEEIFVEDIDIVVGEEHFDHCPMYYKDNKLLSDIFGCYNALEKGVLPEAGGTVDQTEFFSFAIDVVRKSVNDKYDENTKE